MKRKPDKNTKQTTTEDMHNGLPINTDKDKGQACLTSILDKVQAHSDDMISKHTKVMQLRFDLHYPDGERIEPNSQHLQDFNYNLQRKLKREKCTGGHKVDPRLITVTEQHNSIHSHTHGILLVNGNAKQSPYGLLKEIEIQWGQAIGTDAKGLVDHCDKQGKNGIIIDRNKEDFEEKRKQCFYQASYIAKERGKDNQAKGSWLVKGTRIPKK